MYLISYNFSVGKLNLIYNLWPHKKLSLESIGLHLPLVRESVEILNLS